MRPGPSDEFGRVRIRAFGRPWILADVPAFDWILAASEPDLAGIFPGLVDEGDVRDAVRLFIGHERRPDVDLRATRASRVALERAGGREWYWTYNLIGECLKSWTAVNGMLVRQQIRTDRVSLPDWLDAAYTLLMEFYHDKKERTALDSRLQRIPKDALGTVKPKFSSRDDLLAFAAP